MHCSATVMGHRVRGRSVACSRGDQQYTFLGPKDLHKLHGNWVHASIITGVLTVRGKTVTPSVGPPLDFRVQNNVVRYLGFAAIRERCSASLITWVKGSGEDQRTWIWHRLGAADSTPGQLKAGRKDVQGNSVGPDTNSTIARAAHFGGSGKLPSLAGPTPKNQGGERPLSHANARIQSEALSDVITSDEKSAKQELTEEFIEISPPRKKARTKQDKIAERLRNKEVQNESQKLQKCETTKLTGIQDVKLNGKDNIAKENCAQQSQKKLCKVENAKLIGIEDVKFDVNDDISERKHVHENKQKLQKVENAEIDGIADVKVGVKDDISECEHLHHSDHKLQIVESAEVDWNEDAMVDVKEQKPDADLLSNCSTAPTSIFLESAPEEGVKPADNSNRGGLTMEEKIILQDKMDKLSGEQSDRLQEFLEECLDGALNDEADEIEFNLDILPADKVQSYVKLVDKMLEENECVKVNAPPTDCCSTMCPSDIPDNESHMVESTGDSSLSLCPDDSIPDNKSHVVESTDGCSDNVCPGGSTPDNASHMVENATDCSLSVCPSDSIPEVQSHANQNAVGAAASCHTGKPVNDDGWPQKNEARFLTLRKVKKKVCDKSSLMDEAMYRRARKASKTVAKGCNNTDTSVSSTKRREQIARALATLKGIAEQAGEKLAVGTVQQLNDTSISLSVAITNAKELGAPTSDLREFQETEGKLQCQLAERIQALTRLTEVEDHLQHLITAQSEGVSTEDVLHKAKVVFDEANRAALESGASALDVQEYKTRHQKRLQEFKYQRDGHSLWKQNLAKQEAKGRAREEARKRLKS